jgi:hypothetical protein
MQYNPFVRNFGKVRRVLVETLGLPRHAVRPSSKLADLVPRELRRYVWDRLRDEGVKMPPLEAERPGPAVDWSSRLVVSGLILMSLLAFLRSEPLRGDPLDIAWIIGVVLTIAGVVILHRVIGQILTRNAKEISTIWTIEDIVLGGTSPAECRKACYRMSRREISYFTRAIIARNLGVNAEYLKDETSFAEDIGAE